MAVAASEVPMMAVGLLERFCASRTMTVTGMRVMELVLMARNMHIALVAVPGRGLSFSSSFMARRPIGVAALLRPRMLAAMFISIAPMAGCSGGTSGNNQSITGLSA